MKPVYLILIAVGIIFVSCEKKYDDSINYVVNGDINSNTGIEWWYYSGMSHLYKVGFDDSVLVAGKYSLKIESDTLINESADWAQSIKGQLPYGAKLELKVKIKMENVTGSGGAIAVRFDNTERPEGIAEGFVTTQGIVNITGTADWTEYSLISETLTEETKSITVYFLMLNNTKGIIRFDDIILHAIN